MTFNVDHIHFLTILLCGGSLVILNVCSHGEATMTVDEYIMELCVLRYIKCSNEMLIQDIMDLPLKITLLFIINVVGSTKPQMEFQGHMLYALKCIESQVLNYFRSVLANLKNELMYCKRGRKKKFFPRSIVCTFFLERLLGM